MRETSSRSSSRRDICRTWRSMMPPTWRSVASSGSARRSAATPLRIGASGLRSSWASIARNSSLRRSVSRSDFSSALRWPMSRAIDDAPMMPPASLRIGETVSETSMMRPPRATRSVSKGIDPLGPLDAFEDLQLLVAAVLGDDHVDRSADDLVGGVAEHVPGAGVPRQDVAVERLGDDRVLGRFDHRRKQSRGPRRPAGARSRRARRSGCGRAGRAPSARSS